MSKIIEVKNLTKVYGALTAVNDVSFDVNQGEIFGLIGENGAGKSTTLEIIEGLRQMTSGEIKVSGMDVKKKIKTIKSRIGVQLQSSAYYTYLTLKEMLELFGSFYHKQLKAEQLLEMVNLSEKSNSYITQLSGGQRQRFSIVASLVNDPEIVFLDEPTTGLDPLARRNLWEVITNIREQGKTVVLTTHYLEEAELLCDRVGIMDSGRLIALDQTHNLIEKLEHPFKITLTSFEPYETIEKKLGGLGELNQLPGKQGSYELRINQSSQLHSTLSEIIKLKPATMSVSPASLEDVFIELTGKTLKD